MVSRCAKIGLRVLLVFALIIGLLFGAFVILLMALTSGAKVNTATVRKAWEGSALANSYYFEVEEIKNKAEDDKIFLRVSGVTPDVIYICTSSSLSKYCQVKVDAVDRDGYRFDLSGYFWDLHKQEIEDILAKYQGKLHKWTDVQINIYNNDTKAATDFVRELLAIPDIKRLYRAYKQEIERTDSTKARVAFGEYWFDFYEGNNKNGKRLERYSLFEWAQKQGL